MLKSLHSRCRRIAALAFTLAVVAGVVQAADEPSVSDVAQANNPLASATAVSQRSSPVFSMQYTTGMRPRLIISSNRISAVRYC